MDYHGRRFGDPGQRPRLRVDKGRGAYLPLFGLLPCVPGIPWFIPPDIGSGAFATHLSPVVDHRPFQTSG